MGVRNVQLQKCFDFYHADDISRVWGRLFSCTYDGTFKLDPEEVESGDFMSVKVILHRSTHEGQLLFPSNYTIHFLEMSTALITAAMSLLCVQSFQVCCTTCRKLKS